MVYISSYWINFVLKVKSFVFKDANGQFSINFDVVYNMSFF